MPNEGNGLSEDGSRVSTRAATRASPELAAFETSHLDQAFGSLTG